MEIPHCIAPLKEVCFVESMAKSGNYPCMEETLASAACMTYDEPKQNNFDGLKGGGSSGEQHIDVRVL